MSNFFTKKNRKAKSNRKEKFAFSKLLLLQESCLIWVISLSFIVLAYISILKEYTGSLPWLTAMSSLPWGAYAVSQAFYYNKAKTENQKDGIVYETTMAQIESEKNDHPI